MRQLAQATIMQAKRGGLKVHTRPPLDHKWRTYSYAQTRTGWCSLSLHPSSPPTTIPSLPSRYLGSTRRTPRFAILSNTATAIARLWSSPVPSQNSHPSWPPSTSHTDRVRQPEAYPQIMELDIIMQIVFGTFTISIAVFGIWFAWHSTRGMSLHFQLGFYPNAPPDLSLTHLASQERPAAYPLRPTCLVSAA
jgi:hypothetical protein